MNEQSLEDADMMDTIIDLLHDLDHEPLAYFLMGVQDALNRHDHLRPFSSQEGLLTAHRAGVALITEALDGRGGLQ